MTTTPIEIADWMSAKTFGHPRMTATVELSVPDTLELLRSALTAQGYKIKDATRTGFRASWSDRTAWLGILVATDWDFKRTRLAVTATPSPGGTALVIQVDKGPENRPGRRRGSTALTAAFQEAQRRGAAVSTTPWVKP